MENPNNHISVVILDGGSCNSLGVLRCFGQRKIPVILLSTSKENISRYSKYGIKELFREDPRNEENFINDLKLISKKYPGKKFLLPTFDLASLYTFKNKELLSKDFLLPPGDYDVIEQIINKGKLYKLLERYNIEYPRTYYMNPANEEEVISSVEYPCIVKPYDSYSYQKKFGRKCFRCETKDSLREKIKIMRDENLEFVIQESINSSDLYMFYAYFDKTAKVKGICGYKKLRQFPLDYGSGCFCITEWREDLIYPTVNFLEEIGFKGIAEPEFIRDPKDGKYKLLEINGRTSTQNRLSSFLGLDIEYMLFCDVLGKKIEKREIKNGSIAWVEFDKDIISYFGPNGYMKRGIRFSDYLKTYKYKKVFAVFSWGDIKPFIYRVYKLIKLSIRFNKNKK